MYRVLDLALIFLLPSIPPFSGLSCRVSLARARPVLSGPSGRGSSLLHPQGVWAVQSRGWDSETREAQEKGETQEDSVLTITFHPVALVKGQNFPVRANNIRTKRNIRVAVAPVARPDCLCVLGGVGFLLNVAALHILGLLTCFLSISYVVLFTVVKWWGWIFSILTHSC